MTQSVLFSCLSKRSVSILTATGLRLQTMYDEIPTLLLLQCILTAPQAFGLRYFWSNNESRQDFFRSLHLIFPQGFNDLPCPVKPKPGASLVLATAGTASAHPEDPDRVAGQTGSIVGGVLRSGSGMFLTMFLSQIFSSLWRGHRHHRPHTTLTRALPRYGYHIPADRAGSRALSHSSSVRPCSLHTT